MYDLSLTLKKYKRKDVLSWGFFFINYIQSII